MWTVESGTASGLSHNLLSFPQERKKLVKEFNRERRKNKTPKHLKKRKEKLAKANSKR